jgi:hypothetical protein
MLPVSLKLVCSGKSKDKMSTGRGFKVGGGSVYCCLCLCASALAIALLSECIICGLWLDRLHAWKMLVSEWLVSSGFLLLWSGFVGHAPVADFASGGLHQGFLCFSNLRQTFVSSFLLLFCLRAG